MKGSRNDYPFVVYAIKPVVNWIKTNLLLFALAFLVCNGAGSLASGLAGSLALAAAALDSRFLQISLVDGLNMFH